MSYIASEPYLIIVEKLNRTCAKYAHNFTELNKIKEIVSKLKEDGEDSETDKLNSIVQFMKQAKSDELAIKLVYLSFIRDLETFKRRQPIESPTGDYLT